MENITIHFRFKCSSLKQAMEFLEEAKKELGDKNKMPLFEQAHIYNDGVLLTSVAEDINDVLGLTGS